MGNNYYYWLGVSNGDFKYKSNGKPVLIEPIPWASDEPSKSDSETQCVLGNSRNKKWYTNELCSWTVGYTICETSL